MVNRSTKVQKFLLTTKANRMGFLLKIDKTGVGSVADVAGPVVQGMETGIVGIAGHLPRCQYQQSAGSTCVEPFQWWFPVVGDGFLLQEDEGQMLRQSGVGNILLAF